MRSLESMAQRYQRPAWVRRLNRMGDALGGRVLGARRLVPIDADELLALAESSLGGGPFGDFGDPAWRDAFRDLTRAIDAAPLHVVGRLLTRQELLRSLRTRLQLARALDAEPEIGRERIEAPVIVTGPARSGTTILFELLHLDPGLRAPLAWEALHPLPVPEAERDRRAALGECEQELWADVQPEFAAIHELRSDLPVECVTLTEPCFCGPHWPMSIAGVPAPDMERTYAFHRRILQVLQHGRPRASWLLKTPSHLMALPLLFARYPDAWVVQTHRDPARTMPSTVSTAAMVQWMRSDDVDLTTLAALIDAAFGAALNAVGPLRDGGALPKRFVDVHFQDLMNDPVETLRRAYASMGRAFAETHAERVQRYLREKPRGKFGVHRYTAGEWGFDAAELRDRLAPYIERFGVALED
ncbi:MAG: sulfotransferase [Deltaproteobacteria bacterium]|nr:MAG: sulfotransferase [Deltaproteobacteria bacterium]